MKRDLDQIDIIANNHPLVQELGLQYEPLENDKSADNRGIILGDVCGVS